MNSNSIDTIKRDFKKVFEVDLSENEEKIISNALECIDNSKMITANAITSNVIGITEADVDLNYFIYKLKDKIRELYLSVSEVYNKAYSMQVALGKPSNKAIEAEIMKKYPDVKLAYDKVDIAKNLLEYIQIISTSLERISKSIENSRYV